VAMGQHVASRVLGRLGPGDPGGERGGLDRLPDGGFEAATLRTAKGISRKPGAPTTDRQPTS
jgi:hypothetical protein